MGLDPVMSKQQGAIEKALKVPHSSYPAIKIAVLHPRSPPYNGDTTGLLATGRSLAAEQPQKGTANHSKRKPRGFWASVGVT